jgi:phosphoglycolate phosphatase-like HAD superfamily hydrolase
VTTDTAQTERVTVETETLRELITPVRFVLWDLDGPICRLFAGLPARTAARELVELIEARGLNGVLTDEQRAAVDPHVQLLAVHRRHPGSDLALEMEKRLTRHELNAVPTAYPTAYADPLIRTWSTLARFALNTNNSPLAAARYIESRGLTGCFPYIYGRTQDLDLMKPNPHTLRQALNAMGADPTCTLMIGDAPTDFEAAEKAGISFLGYARNEKKREELMKARVRPGHIVNSLARVIEVLPQYGPLGVAN